MVSSKAATVEAYLDELDEDRRAIVSAVRDVVNRHLPDGYEEAMNWGMITWQIPLGRYPDTYNGQPLAYAALASQKQYVSLYLHGVYADPELAETFVERYRATGRTPNMGKSCVRFRRLDDLPLELVAETVAAMGVDEYLARYEASRRGGRC